MFVQTYPFHKFNDENAPNKCQKYMNKWKDFSCRQLWYRPQNQIVWNNLVTIWMPQLGESKEIRVIIIKKGKPLTFSLSARSTIFQATRWKVKICKWTHPFFQRISVAIFSQFFIFRNNSQFKNEILTLNFILWKRTYRNKFAKTNWICTVCDIKCSIEFRKVILPKRMKKIAWCFDEDANQLTYSPEI